MFTHSVYWHSTFQGNLYSYCRVSKVLKLSLLDSWLRLMIPLPAHVFWKIYYQPLSNKHYSTVSISHEKKNLFSPFVIHKRCKIILSLSVHFMYLLAHKIQSAVVGWQGHLKKEILVLCTEGRSLRLTFSIVFSKREAWQTEILFFIWATFSHKHLGSITCWLNSSLEKFHPPSQDQSRTTFDF